MVGGYRGLNDLILLAAGPRDGLYSGAFFFNRIALACVVDIDPRVVTPGIVGIGAIRNMAERLETSVVFRRMASTSPGRGRKDSG